MWLNIEAIKNGFKKLNKTKGFGMLIIAAVAGLMLLLLPNRESGDETVITENPFTSEQYCALLEQKAEELIKELPEVDDCKVFITLESGYRYIYATDQHVREESGMKQTDKTIVLADGANGDTPILIEETMPEISGVAVVCSGASYETQYRIIELLCALFDIKSHRINVQT